MRYGRQGSALKFLFYKCLFVLFFTLSLLASASEGRWSGNLKSYLLKGEHSILSETLKDSEMSLVLSGRFNGIYHWSENWQMEFGYEWDWQTAQSPKAKVSALTPQGYRYDDIESHPRALQGEESFFQQNLDRAQVIYYVRSWEWHLGRQALSFGSGKMVNPTDIFFAFPLASIDQEYRRGVDALRFRKGFGAMGEVDGGYVFGPLAHKEDSAFYMNIKQVFYEWDVAVMMAVFKENELLGFDLQGDIFGHGIWWESAWTEYKSDGSKGWEGGSAFRSVIGFDYRISSTQSLWIFEFHYNGAGQKDSDRYTEQINDVSFFEGAVFLLGQSYLSPGLQWEWSPLLHSTHGILWNLNDHSTFFTTQLDYNVADDLIFNGQVYAPQGPGKSEFSQYPFFASFSLKYYF